MNPALLNSVRILPNAVSSEQNSLAKFRDYSYRNFRKNASKARLSNAQKYCSVLLDGDASELMSLSYDKIIHTMKSLPALSKFLGRYDEWRKIVGEYQLKWSNNNDYTNGGSKGLETFHNIFDINIVCLIP